MGASFLCRADHTTGDLCSCVASRLGAEIIGHTVNDYGLSYHICQTETVCCYPKPSTAAAQHQRWKIPGVARVEGIYRVIVAACVGKVSACAAAAFVDVKTVEAGIIWRKSFDIRLDQDEAVSLVEANPAVYARSVLAAFDICYSL